MALFIATTGQDNGPRPWPIESSAATAANREVMSGEVLDPDKDTVCPILAVTALP